MPAAPSREGGYFRIAFPAPILDVQNLEVVYNAVALVLNSFKLIKTYKAQALTA